MRRLPQRTRKKHYLFVKKFERVTRRIGNALYPVGSFRLDTPPRSLSKKVRLAHRWMSKGKIPSKKFIGSIVKAARKWRKGWKPRRGPNGFPLVWSAKGAYEIASNSRRRKRRR